MLVLIDNHSTNNLATDYPGMVGRLFSPGRWRDPKGLPFALDNGRFVCWSANKPWDEAKFWKLLETSQRDAPGHCRWVVVPDVVADAEETFRWWEQWAPRIHGFHLALAVQDGMTPESVKRHTSPDLIFVGGTTAWKRRTIWAWCHSFQRVHIGRINTERWLWNCLQCGAESCDGSGWFRGCQRQLAGLHRFLRMTRDGINRAQMQLEFARTFKGHVPERPIT